MTAPHKINRQFHKDQGAYLIRVPLAQGESHWRNLTMDRPVEQPAEAEAVPRKVSVQGLRQEAAKQAKQGNYQLASELLTRVIQSSLSRRTPMDYNNRGLMYFHMGRMEEAIANYNRALDLNPNLAAAYNNRANCYVNQGDPIEALIDYDRALDLNPFHIRALINQGITFRHLGMYQEALDNFDIALAQGKLEGYIYAQRGRTHHFAGDWNWAIADYLRSLDLLAQQPNSPARENSRIGQVVNTWLQELMTPLSA